MKKDRSIEDIMNDIETFKTNSAVRNALCDYTSTLIKSIYYDSTKNDTVLPFSAVKIAFENTLKEYEL